MIKKYGEFKLIKKIGSGSFGEVFSGEDSTGNKVAIKLEKIDIKVPQLLNESKIYNCLQKIPFVPRMYYFESNNECNILVTELLGPSLEDVFNNNNRKFDPSSILFIGMKLMEIIESFHENSFIHRDIKPENFLIGTKKTNKIYIIDFGLSKKFRNVKTFEHIKYCSDKSLVGTPRYASLHNHLGNELSRRDDLESIGYMLIYFTKGVLPWQGLKSGRSTGYMKIYNKKVCTDIRELCKGPIEKELITYMEYVKNLKFEDSPNYLYLKAIFCESINRFPKTTIFSG